MNETYPFDIVFVMKETSKHIKRSIEISTRKTITRLKDFENNPTKCKEVLETLEALNAYVQLIEDFENHNPKLFKDYEVNNETPT